MKHFANAHFPGLYSIGLIKRPYTFTRMYLAKPGELHPDLCNYTGNFLWHSHAYDFLQTPVLGSITDIHLEIGHEEEFNCYEFEGRIDSGKKPELKFVSKALVNITESKVYYPTETFELRKNVIHRVVFSPDINDGWFASVVTEFNYAEKPKFVYSKNLLTQIPNVDSLYTEISEDEAREIVNMRFPGMVIGKEYDS